MRRLLSAAMMVLGLLGLQAILPAHMDASIMPTTSTEQHYVLSAKAVRKMAHGFHRAMMVAPVAQKRSWLATLTGTVDAQQAYQLCDDVFANISEWEFQGWDVFSIQGSADLGPYFSGYDEWMYWGYYRDIDGSGSFPFEFFCLVPWY